MTIDGYLLASWTDVSAVVFIALFDEVAAQVLGFKLLDWMLSLFDL